MYRYIDTRNKQIIINTTISSSTTTIKNTKTNKEYSNTKYIAHLPQDVLILLLEKEFNTIPDAAASANNIAAEWIKNILAENKIYLQFIKADPSGSDEYNINIVYDDIDNSNCVSIRSAKKYDNYTFTASKRLFNLLKNNDGCNYSLQYVIKFDNDLFSLDNCVVSVRLV